MPSIPASVMPGELRGSDQTDHIAADMPPFSSMGMIMAPARSKNHGPALFRFRAEILDIVKAGGSINLL